MSSSHQYHQPNAPDPLDDDHDSDLGIDLHELDPIAADGDSSPPRASNGRKSQERSHPNFDFGNRIPLRNLRFGGLRNARRNRVYGELGYRQDKDEDDLHGLLRDEDGSKGNRDHEDDAPLLPGPGGPSTRRSARPKDALTRLGSHIRLPSFLSTSPALPTTHVAPDEEQEADVDHDPSSNRTVSVGEKQSTRYPPNAVSNAKYTPWSFLPRTLYNEFSFFFNLYFLLVALSQIIPALRIGYLSTYIAPLAFVLAITLGKEALDDIARRRRDNEANSEAYNVLKFQSDGGSTNGSTKRTGRLFRNPRKSKGKDIQSNGNARGDVDQVSSRVTVSEISKASKDLRVGDVLKLGKNQRVPADVVILQTYSSETIIGSGDMAEEDGAATSSGMVGDKPSDTDSAGEAFIRTDQLDGETDWKLRLASPLSQLLDVTDFTRLQVTAGKPDRKVNDFVGTIELLPAAGRSPYDPVVDKDDAAPEAEADPVTTQSKQSASLTIDNTAWANTVLASSCTVLAVVVYTGPQTRSALSTSASRSKVGLLEYEINNLTKILCFLTLAISFILVALSGFHGHNGRAWYIDVMRFLILFSTIVPISLRVNLDMGKSVYARFIEKDQGIPGTVVRTSTIPEDLGRIEYLLSDKTGTLTQNEMEMKRIHVGTVSYANDAMDEVSSYIRQGFTLSADDKPGTLFTPSSVFSAPSSTATRTRREIGSRVRDVVLALALCHNVTPTVEEENGQTITTYQASSPDEIAIIKWTEMVGLRLVRRDRKTMVLQSVHSDQVVVRVHILNIFPFTSESKRMGVVVQFQQSESSTAEDDNEIWFYQKGADTVMSSIVAANDWLDEETANMAREGLRTLVVGRKRLSFQRYKAFSESYNQASLSLQGRDRAMSDVVREYLEDDLELLGVTGVEDRLQRDVKPSLELLRNAGIKIWMLTGDKVETARCVAVSSKLVARGQYIHTIAKLKRKDLAQDSLDFLRSKPDACLLIDGESLALMLTHYRDAFISLAVLLPAVVACRCSPTQKAEVANLIRSFTKKRVACIGDGGNDVSMIQAADVGVGIVGKEGRQASLAADFSITQFCHLTKLLVWHGRNSYKRSAKLAQFVIHRGLIISVCQTMFSIASDFEPHALYRDWLLVGYATVYTMAPVFSLVLDKDVDESLANLYPELYKELKTGRSLSYRTFFVWVAVSIYQGCVIQGLSQILVGLADFPKMVSVSFTVLVLNELIMVAAEVTTWHPVMIFAIVGTGLVYIVSILALGEYFDLSYVITVGFLWRVVAILAISLVPPYSAKIIRRTWKPPSYRKVQGV